MLNSVFTILLATSFVLRYSLSMARAYFGTVTTLCNFYTTTTPVIQYSIPTSPRCSTELANRDLRSVADRVVCSVDLKYLRLQYSILSTSAYPPHSRQLHSTASR